MPRSSDSKPWSAKVIKLRTSLGMNQQRFADELRTTQQRVSTWENGTSEPSASAFIALANLAATIDIELSLWFWKKAGVTEQVLKGLVPGLESRFLELLAGLRSAKADSVRVPISRDPASLLKPATISGDEWIAADGRYVSTTARAFVVPHQQYSLSHPAPGDIVIVEASQAIDANNASSINKLAGRFVAALADYGDSSFDPRLAMPPGLWIGELRFGERSTGYGGRDREAKVSVGDKQPVIAWKVIEARDEHGPKAESETDFELFKFVKFVAPVLQWIRSSENREKNKK